MKKERDQKRSKYEGDVSLVYIDIPYDVRNLKK